VIHPSISERASFLATRPRNHMLVLAAKYEDVISLGRGDPDLPTPPHIVEAAYPRRPHALHAGFGNPATARGDLRETEAGERG